jgi:hypothetical protein
MWHAWERGETRRGFWWESPKEKDHLKDQGAHGRMGSKWTLRILAGGCGVCSPCSSLGLLACSVINLRILRCNLEMFGNIVSHCRDDR